MVSVLVVEDDDVSRELIASRLERAGHDVRSAPSAPAARRLMADLVPDVLVSDMFMPGGSALALVTDLRAARDTADLPVVLLSGRALPADVEAGAALGCAYLRKPFAVRTLLEAVDAAADQPSRGVEAVVLRRLAELGDLDDPAERELFARLVGSCAEQLVAGLAQLTRLVRAHDRAGVEALAHRLAGSAANVGADRVSRLLREVEASAARGRLLEQADLQSLRAEVPVAQRALAGVAHALTGR